MSSKKKIGIQICIAFFSILLLSLMLKDLYPLIKTMIINKNDEALTIDYIQKYGSRGVPILFSLEFLQVILPFIPTALVEILIGLCYGPFWGSLICISGLAVGNGLVFFLIRHYQQYLPSFFHQNNSKKAKKHRLFNKDFITQSKHPELLLMILYSIPIFPNSLLAFLFEKTELSVIKYVLSVVIGSIPSVVLYTVLGRHLSRDSYPIAIIIAVIILIVIIALYLKKDKIISSIEKIAS
ncbi:MULTISPECIES: VTT domain-containing protein [unclassified Enterococcus]|uniref:TVP38/TMEM64 family protein n=1 Tax=unclassified Enterococcus TaxID=2608891 RepID=UPI0015549789|nr:MULTISPECIES: VTT domain-containing protein [unclassified Enterococcus]MBS7577038.1 TVP38/TMEM64 family protein [Enterococcus sp. MMGLQ5-2]MBS7584515.1 TVP38/TMEM64 family protein [Enterococcus sp. MMGLQ5-1]NPD12370.1 TVP38/TMEM64 family protein [Enterococcus sp. MMGLQ5-1]NPD36872.1 TVP38/TMEM64 family protein [Enterococcus sp. MMGLQ5-2]